MQKLVYVKAKANLKSSTMIRDSDTHYFRGHRLFHNTSSKMHTQGFSHMDFFCSEKFKNKDLKPAPLCGNMAEPSKKEDKNKRLQEHRQEQNKQIPAISVNIKISKKKRRNMTPVRLCDLIAIKKSLCQQLHQAKKLVYFLAISLPVIHGVEKIVRMPYICYQIWL